MMDFEPDDDAPPRSRPTWRRGNCAGQGFRPNGDLWVAKWVTSPKGVEQILITECGFRDTDSGRQKVILDREIVDPPTYGKGKQ